MNDDMNLHVDITADSASAVTSVDALNARLSALEAAFNRGGVGAGKAAGEIEKVASTSERAAIKAEAMGGALSKLAALSNDLASHTRVATQALNTLGLRTGAAMEKVAGLGQLFQGMGNAVPGLLAAGSAVAGIFAAFEEAKDAAGAAAQWQQNLALLGQTVRNQGGDWANLTKSVQAWADVQEKTTQYSRDQAVQALTTLTSTGMKLSDAMRVTRVAEDAAAATGRSLAEINFSLSEAMHGRTQALTLLGIGTKQSIHDGMKFSDILKEIEKHMGGAAAAAADTYAGKVAQLHNAMETLQEKIGSAVLPALTALTKAMISLIENAENTFSRWSKAISAWANEHKTAIADVEGFLKGGLDVFRTVFDAIAGLVKGAVQVFGGLVEFISSIFTSDWRTGWDGIKNIFEGILHGMFGVFGSWGDNLIVIAERIAKAVGGIFSHIFSGMGSAVHGDFKGALNDLNGMMSGFSGLTSGLNWSFHDTVSGIQDAFGASGSSESNGVNIGDISSGLADEMAGGKLPSIAKHLKHIAHAAKKAKEQLDAFAVSVYGIKDPLANVHDNKLLAQVVGADTTNPMYGYDPKANAEMQKRLDESQKMWESYYKTLEQNASQWTNTTMKWIDEMFAHGKKGVNSFVHAFQDMLKQIEQALLKSALFELFMGGQGAKGPSFMSLFMGNMGFGSKEAKTDGTGGIIGGLIGTSASSQLASSLPTDSIMSLMFGVGAPSMSGGGASSVLGGAAAVIAGAGGPGGGTLAGSSILGGGGGILGDLGSLGGMKSGIGAISALLGTHLGSYSLGGGYGSFFSSSGSLGTLGSGLLGAAGGYLVGSGIGNLVFGGQPLNSGTKIGGAIGGGAGAIFGPALDAMLGIGTGGLGLILGPLLGSIGGSLLGGLLGNHDNPANMPDKYNTTQFGQIVADLTGAGGSSYWSTDPTAPKNHTWFGANGQKFFSNIGDLTGGTSGISWIEQTLAKYAKPGTTQMGANTPDWLKPLWGQLVSTFGVSASGSGQLNFGHDIGQEWITGAAGASGQQTSYSQLGSLLQQFIQDYMTQGQVGVTTGNAPGTGGIGPSLPGQGSGFGVYSPFAGAYVVGAPGSAPTLSTNSSGLPTFALNNPTPTSGSPSPSNPGAGKTLRHTGAINVTVNVQGSVTAESDLAQKIHDRLIEMETRNINASHMAYTGFGL